MVSVLSAVLSGAWGPIEADDRQASPQYRQSSKGHFFAAIRIDQFLPPNDFRNAMDAMIDVIQNVPRENGAEPIHYPGAKEFETFSQRTRDGVPLTPKEVRDFRALSEKFKIDPPQ